MLTEKKFAGKFDTSIKNSEHFFVYIDFKIKCLPCTHDHKVRNTSTGQMSILKIYKKCSKLNKTNFTLKIVKNILVRESLYFDINSFSTGRVVQISFENNLRSFLWLLKFWSLQSNPTTIRFFKARRRLQFHNMNWGQERNLVASMLYSRLVDLSLGYPRTNQTENQWLNLSFLSSFSSGFANSTDLPSFVFYLVRQFLFSYSF